MSESEIWKIGDACVISAGGHHGHVRGLTSNGTLAFVEYESGAISTRAISELNRPPKPKKMQLVTINEYKSPFDSQLVYWSTRDGDRPYASRTGRTFTFEVEEK